MKLLNILSLLLVALVSLTSAQRCQGGTRTPLCTGGVNVGTGGRRCRASRVWSYDARTRQCRRIQYLGCGGNQNRWCTQVECESRCRRP